MSLTPCSLLIRCDKKVMECKYLIFLLDFFPTHSHITTTQTQAIQTTWGSVENAKNMRKLLQVASNVKQL